MRATIKIIQRVSYITKDGKCPLCLQYTSYRQTTYIGLNISVEPGHWSDTKKMVLSGEKYHLQYNRKIKEQLNKADKIIFDHFTKPLPVTAFIRKLKDKLYDNTDFYVFAGNELEFLKLSESTAGFPIPLLIEYSMFQTKNEKLKMKN